MQLKGSEAFVIFLTLQLFCVEAGATFNISEISVIPTRQVNYHIQQISHSDCKTLINKHLWKHLNIIPTELIYNKSVTYDAIILSQCKLIIKGWV